MNTSYNSSFYRFAVLLMLVSTISGCASQLVPLSLHRGAGLAPNEKIQIRLNDGEIIEIIGFWVRADSLGGTVSGTTGAGTPYKNSQTVAFTFDQVEDLQLTKWRISALSLMILGITGALVYGASTRKVTHANK